MSLPTRERELKLAQGGLLGLALESLPTRERELKRKRDVARRWTILSLPTRERELKRVVAAFVAVRLGRSLHGSVN